MGLRRIETSIMDAYLNLALEEAIFRLNEGVAVRLWGNERSVIIGRTQLAQYETDMSYCERMGIPVVRRFTAGGAVYNGSGNLNWSIFVREGFDLGRLKFVRDTSRIFRMAASILTETLSRLGVSARFDEPNRIVTEKGKVCGMAAYLSKERLLCHGTMLLSADLDEAAALTRPSALPLDRRYVRSRSIGIANVCVEEGAFARAFWDVIDGESISDSGENSLRDKEIELAKSFEKYKDASWNTGDPFQYPVSPH